MSVICSTRIANPTGFGRFVIEDKYIDIFEAHLIDGCEGLIEDAILIVEESVDDLEFLFSGLTIDIGKSMELIVEGIWVFDGDPPVFAVAVGAFAVNSGVHSWDEADDAECKEF